MATTSQTVQKLYIAYFGRPADPAGATNAAKLVEWAGSPDALLVDFGKSAEYTSQFAGLTSAQIVNTIYNNLFGRNAEATGLNFWAAKVDSGEIPLSTATWTILSGVTAGSVDDIAVNSKVSYAESFTAKLATDAAAAVAYNASTLAMVKAELAKIVDATTLAAETGSLDTFVSSVATTGGTGVPGDTFTLTTGIDLADVAGSFRNGGVAAPGVATDFKFTSGNEVVNGSTTTLNAGDSLADGFTTDNDVFNVAVSGPTALQNVANIETINLSTTGATAASAITYTTLTGLKTLNISGTSAGNITFTDGGANDIGNTGVTTIDASGLTTAVGLIANSSASTATAAMTMKGAAGADQLTGGLGNDSISGGTGADFLSGMAGNDTIDGGAGGDEIDGGNGNDIITGGAGADVIVTTAGNDTVTGGTGSDSILLGAATVALVAGGGALTAVGGVTAAGSNTVVFESVATAGEVDTISGFTVGAVAAGGDVLKVSDFLGAAVANFTTITVAGGLADNVATSNVVVITDGTLAAAIAAGGVTFGANAKVVLVEHGDADATTDGTNDNANVFFVTTDANGTVTSNVQVASLVGVATDAGAGGFSIGLTAANFA